MKKAELIIAVALSGVATAMAGIGTVSVGTTEAVVLAARAERKWAILQNNSTNDIYVKIDSSTNAVTAVNGIKIPANGGTLSLASDGSAPVRNTIRAISGAGTNTLTFQEGDEN